MLICIVGPNIYVRMRRHTLTRAHSLARDRHAHACTYTRTHSRTHAHLHDTGDYPTVMSDTWQTVPNLTGCHNLCMYVSEHKWTSTLDYSVGNSNAQHVRKCPRATTYGEGTQRRWFSSVYGNVLIILHRYRQLPLLLMFQHDSLMDHVLHVCPDTGVGRCFRWFKNYNLTSHICGFGWNQNETRYLF